MKKISTNKVLSETIKLITEYPSDQILIYAKNRFWAEYLESSLSQEGIPAHNTMQSKLGNVSIFSLVRSQMIEYGTDRLERQSLISRHESDIEHGMNKSRRAKAKYDAAKRIESRRIIIAPHNTGLFLNTLLFSANGKMTGLSKEVIARHIFVGRPIDMLSDIKFNDDECLLLEEKIQSGNIIPTNIDGLPGKIMAIHGLEMQQSMFTSFNKLVEAVDGHRVIFRLDGSTQGTNHGLTPKKVDTLMYLIPESLFKYTDTTIIDADLECDKWVLLHDAILNKRSVITNKEDGSLRDHAIRHMTEGKSLTANFLRSVCGRNQLYQNYRESDFADITSTLGSGYFLTNSSMLKINAGLFHTANNITGDLMILDSRTLKYEKSSSRNNEVNNMVAGIAKTTGSTVFTLDNIDTGTKKYQAETLYILTSFDEKGPIFRAVLEARKQKMISSKRYSKEEIQKELDDMTIRQWGVNIARQLELLPNLKTIVFYSNVEAQNWKRYLELTGRARQAEPMNSIRFAKNKNGYNIKCVDTSLYTKAAEKVLGSYPQLYENNNPSIQSNGRITFVKNPKFYLRDLGGDKPAFNYDIRKCAATGYLTLWGGRYPEIDRLAQDIIDTGDKQTKFAFNSIINGKKSIDMDDVIRVHGARDQKVFEEMLEVFNNVKSITKPFRDWMESEAKRLIKHGGVIDNGVISFEITEMFLPSFKIVRDKRVATEGRSVSDIANFLPAFYITGIEQAFILRLINLLDCKIVYEYDGILTDKAIDPALIENANKAALTNYHLELKTK